MHAWFSGKAFARHRHDTYAIGLTESGIQSFSYRGSSHRSRVGQVVVLHPDEPHDGFAGTALGFGYRILYIDPSRIGAAVRAVSGHSASLPFVRDPVVRNPRLAQTIARAFTCEFEPLAVDTFMLAIAEALIKESGWTRSPATARPMAFTAVHRARRLLDEAKNRVVRSAELEAAAGLSRFELARQFRSLLGTSPYRYSLMRRLEFARDRLGEGHPAVAVALDAGFADQAHFTRQFRAAFGLTPARYEALRRNGLKS